MAAATTITLVAGGVTFVNEWYQTKNIDWKVPLATVIAAAAMEGFAHLDDKAATALAVIVLMGAATTQFNGKSAINTITDLTNSTKTAPPKGSVSKIPGGSQ